MSAKEENVICRYGTTYGYAQLLRALSESNVEERLTMELKRRFDTKHVFLLNSCRAALCVLLRAYGRTGEIILPGYTCRVVPESVTAAGYVPVFSDIEAHSVNLSVDAVARAVSPRTAGVILTHLFGVPCEVRELLALCRRRGLLAIEDVAPAFGATVDGIPVGSFGDAAVLSFNMTKVINAGMGGALITRDDDLARRIAQVIGQDSRALFGNPSWALARALAWRVGTSKALYSLLQRARTILRPDEAYQSLTPHAFVNPKHGWACSRYVAALFALQLPNLEQNIARRRHLADLYAHELGRLDGIGVVEPPAGALPAWIQYPVFVASKRDFARRLLRRSIDVSWTFRYSAAASYGGTDCPNSELAAKTIVGLPTYPAVTDAEAASICSAIRECVTPAHIHLPVTV
jgi:dTDP-4-amino-4,6-dideoxygalactose transaminase